MRSLAPLRRLRPLAWPLLGLLVLQPFAGTAPAFAAMIPGDAASFGQPRPIAPADGERVAESALAFVYELPADAARSWLVVSRDPIDPGAWRGVPQGPGLVVVDAARRPATLADLGLDVRGETTLHWTVVSKGRSGETLHAPAARSVIVAPRFENRVGASPFLVETRRGMLAPGEIEENARLRRGLVTPIDAKLARPAAASEASGTSAPRIRLSAGYAFAPTVEGEPAMPLALTSARAMAIEDADPSAVTSYLVQFDAPPSDAQRAAIARAGGAVFAYIPDQAFLVRMTRQARATFAAGTGAAWVGEYQPAYKVSPIFGDVSLPQGDEWKLLLFPDASIDAAAQSLAERGFVVASRSDNGVNKMLRLKTPAGMTTEEALARAAGLSAVAWVEPVTPKVLDNTNAQWVVQTNLSANRRVWDQGIRGQGQILMTSDSGISMAHDQFRDPAVTMTAFGFYPTHRKVIAYLKGSSSADVVFGDHSGAAWHGSHTGCTIAGWDDPVGGAALNQDGMAKEAKLFFMDISGPALANGVFPFDDLNDLFTPPYLGNARVSSNSWGSAVSGQYTLDALAVDQFVWTHPDMYIAFSNGNSASAGSVGSPATAKNVAGMGGTGNGTLAGNLYTSTSRGPTTDGRRKPMICSPGQNVSSAQGTTPTSYALLSGTSMAAPTGTGAVALMRQYCTDGWYPTGAAVPANGFEPSAALLKAMAVNAADNAVTGQVAPNNNVGFGRIKIDNVLWFAGDVRKTLLADQVEGLGQGQYVEYQVNVTDGSIPLEVSLCWSDYPGNPAGGVQLVNNLDLTVTNGVSTYRGNSFTSGFSNTNNVVDVLNVEENVLINLPSTGVWTVRVAAPTVPIGPQPYGLCITGGVGQAAGALALDRAEYGSTSVVEIQVTDTNAGAGPLSVNVTSPTEPGGQLVSLAGGDGVFTGTLQLTAANPDGGDGELSVSNGDALSATYADASPVASIVAQATVSYATPVITNVKATSQGAAGTLVTWNTNLNATSRVHYGLTPALELGTVQANEARLAHAVLLTGLTPGASYHYDVESVALNGNSTRDDAGGAHYRFTAKGSGDILFVLGDAAYPRMSAWTLAFAATNYDYDVWSGPLADNPLLGDRDGGLRSYKAVIWQCGLESYPPFLDNQRTVITDYLNGGGRLAVVGHDIAWAFGDAISPSPVYTAERNTWMQNTLKTTWQADPATWLQQNGYAGDPISGPNSPGVGYEPFRSGGAGDEVDIAPGAGGASAYVWRNTDTTPDDVGFRWESGVPNGSSLTALWGGAPSRLATMYFEFSSMDPPFSAPSAVRNGILDRTLLWLFGRARPAIAVTAPNGGEVLTGDDVNITWTETLGGGVNAASRTIEYTTDGGDSWTVLSTSAGPSPFLWDLTTVPNTDKARVRVRVVDDGTPAPLAQTDASNANFTIARTGGDTAGPVVVAGSIAVAPNPIVRPNPATLSAQISDATTGASAVAAAEWSYGPSAAAAGTGTALPLSGSGVTRPAGGSIDTTPISTGPHTLWVRGQDAAGNWGPAAALAVQVNGAELVGVGDVPRIAFLDQNAPNPFAGRTSIRFGLPRAAAATIGIFDVQGRRVRGLLEGHLPAGEHAAAWDGRDDRGRRAPAGVYFYVFRAEGQALQKRMMLLP